MRGSDRRLAPSRDPGGGGRGIAPFGRPTHGTLLEPIAQLTLGKKPRRAIPAERLVL
jgi:hypothetical protein